MKIVKHYQMKNSVKNMLGRVGLRVEWRDPLVEQIPSNYEQSAFLPRVYLNSLKRILYFDAMVQQTRDIPGDVVECGTSVGHGMLLFMLLSNIHGLHRQFLGFDSFEGFPSPTDEDLGTHAYAGYYANAPEVVLRVLKDGRVPERAIRDDLTLVKGYFCETLPGYDGQISLLHLDCDLYESYRICLEALYDRVAPGGIIMFDEYGDEHFPGCRKAVDEFFAGKPERLERHSYGKYFATKVAV